MTEKAPAERGALVGDYRFHRDDPWTNGVGGRLPAIQVGWGEHRDGEIAHGVSAAAQVPCPVLYGRVPEGGAGAGIANNWALAWTTSVRAYIPEHPDLNLGRRFTQWVRLYFAGTATEEQADWPVRLLTRWQSPPDRGYVLWCRPPGVITFTAAFNDIHANWSATDPSMRLDTVGWYDVAVAFDGSVLSIYCTPIGSDGPGESVVQRFSREPGCRPRFSVLDAAINEVGGDLRVMQSGGMLEHLLLYREEALDAGQVANLSTGVSVRADEDAGPLDVGANTQLFLDDAVVAQRTGVVRQWHEARKHPDNPLLTKDPNDPAQCTGPSSHISVLYDEEDDLFKMWYHEHQQAPIQIFPKYATSRDGVTWERPPLGMCGTGNAVRVEPMRGITNLKAVWKDPQEADSDCRYKAFGYPMEYYTSPDGFDWRHRGQAMYGADDASMGMPLSESGRYLFAIRPIIVGKPPGFRTEAVAIADSPLGNTMPLKLVFTPDESDLARDPHLQFYHMPVYEYKGWFLSPLSVYHSDDETDGRTETQWAWSRDGLDWQRSSERPSAIALGEPESWDSSAVLAASTLVHVGDELRMYYSGSAQRHHETKTKAIGLATLREDGFASLRADERGTVTTIAFECEGPHLTINANASSGSVRVAVLDEQGGPLDGFSADQCEPFAGDAVSHVVTWRDRRSLEGLKERTIRLRFDLHRAELYAFRIGS